MTTADVHPDLDFSPERRTEARPVAKVVGKLTASLGVEAFHEAAEEWDGEVRQDGNLGRTEVLGAATLGHTFGATELSLGVRVPVWRDIVTGDEPPGTLSSPLTLSLGVSHVFGGSADEPK